MSSAEPAPAASPLPRLSGSALQLLAMLAGALLLLWDSVTGRIFFDRDIHLFWLPQMEGLRSILRLGGLPLWDPHVSFGHPMLANPNTQVLYPLTWLGTFIEPGSYYTIYVLLHTLAAGVGVSLLARQTGSSQQAGVVGGLLFMGSGPLLSLLSQWHHFGAACFSPWVLLANERVLASPGPGRGTLLGLAIAGQALAGSPDLSFLTVIIVAARCVSVFPWRALRSPASYRLAASIAAAALVATGAAAVLWMPTLEVTVGSARWRPSAGGPAAYWSLSPLALAQMVIPVPLSELPLHAPAPPDRVEVWHPLLRSIYVGLPALGLALIGAYSRRLAWSWLFIAVAAVLWAMGRHTPFYEVSLVLLPPLRMLRHPAKAMALASVVLCLAAAAGVDVLAAARTRYGQVRLLTAVTLLGLGCATIWASAVAGLVPASVIWYPAIPALGAALLGMLLLGVLPSSSARARALAALAVVELLLTHRHLNPTAPAAFLKYRPPLVDALRAAGAERLYVWDYAFRTTTSLKVPVRLEVFYARSRGASLDLSSALFQQSYLYPLACARWGFTPAYDLDHLGLFPPPLAEINVLLRAVEGTPAFLRLLQVGAVDHVIALHEEGHERLTPVATLHEPLPVPIRVYGVPDHLPRVYAVAGVRQAADTESTFKTLLSPDFDPAREVVLAESAPRSPPAGLAGRVTILRDTGDRLVLRADMSDAGHVVIADTFAPGWRATVDGRRAEILRANGVFRAVPVERGVHEVELLYRPGGLLIGACVTTGTLCVVTVFGWRVRRRRRTRP